MRTPLLELAALGMIGCTQETSQMPEPTDVNNAVTQTATALQSLPKCDKTAMFGSEDPSSTELAEFWEAHWPGQELTVREATGYKCLGDFAPNIVVSERGDYVAAIVRDPQFYCSVTPCAAELRVNGQMAMAADQRIKLWLLNDVSEKGIGTFTKTNLRGSTYDTRNYSDINLSFLSSIPPLCQ